MMRTGVAALGALSLINLASAKPSGHHRRHQELHEKRQEVVYETDYSYVTTQLPNVVVFVDENGAPYSTSTEGQAAATVVASSAAVYTEAAAKPAYTEAASSSTEVYVAPTPTTLASVYKAPSSKESSTTQAPTISSAAAYSSAASSSKAPASSSAASSGSGPSGYGIVYSPYSDNGGCKSQDEVNSDFAKIHSYAQSNGDSFDFVRIYGTDCNQVTTVLSACEQYDLKIFAGVYTIWDAKAFSDELTILTKAASGSWDRFQTISIGNEVVNSGKVAAGAVKGLVDTAKATLTAAGYSGPVVAVDTLVAVVANPELCDASDYVAVNSHPFFDGGVAAENSGEWLVQQMQRVSEVCGGKETWITETGWPTQGNTNGVAVPSVQNQKAAISSMKAAVSSNIVWFTAFNDMWKSNSASTFNAEQYWGMCNN
ncbi:glycoside hydrolase [Aureobasidium subglaciale]|nr:glycoside hydrolase [Aureobasidium subglaciale]